MVNQSPRHPLADEAERLIAQGQTALALAALKEALKVSPQDYRGWITLSRLLHGAGQYSEAVQAAQAAERFDPLTDEFAEIQVDMQARRLNDARQRAQAMLAAEPGHPRAVFTLAHLARQAGDHEGRVRLIDEGLQASPANLALRQLAIGALEDAGAFDRVIPAARAFAQLEGSPGAQLMLATVLFRFGRNGEALATIETAIRQGNLAPGLLSDMHLNRGHILRVLGEREASVAAFRESLALNRLNGAPWWGLADMKDYSFTEADMENLSGLIANPSATQEARTLAGFALAKAREVDGDLRAAMVHYQRANQLAGSSRFRPEAFAGAIERMVRELTSDKFVVQAVQGPSGDVPVFIIGMPRSGSTLVEQILASHSRVEGSVEHLVLPSIKQKAHRYCAASLGPDYLQHMGRIPPETLASLGAEYLAQTACFRAGETRVFTDKLPYNFEHVGLIHKILPTARIIDVRRHPMDCGFSIYKQHFAQGADYSYRLDHIGAYCNGYLRLMDHWNRVLPGRVHLVQYEHLIREPETTVRALLDFVGLEFEADCLEFHRNRRAVRTASSEQVRRPIYTDSVGVWKAVETELKPLSDALGPETLARFETLFG